MDLSRAASSRSPAWSTSCVLPCLSSTSRTQGPLGFTMARKGFGHQTKPSGPSMSLMTSGSPVSGQTAPSTSNAHSRRATWMKSVLRAIWRPVQIRRPNPHATCGRSLRLPSRLSHRSGSKSSVLLPYTDSSREMLRWFPTTMDPAGIRYPRYVSSVFVACGKPPGKTGRQRSTSSTATTTTIIVPWSAQVRSGPV